MIKMTHTCYYTSSREHTKGALRQQLIKTSVLKYTSSMRCTSVTSHPYGVINTPFSSPCSRRGTNTTAQATGHFQHRPRTKTASEKNFIALQTWRSVTFPHCPTESFTLIMLWLGYKTLTNDSFRWGNETDSFSSTHQSKPSTSLCIHCAASPTFSFCCGSFEMYNKMPNQQIFKFLYKENKECRGCLSITERQSAVFMHEILQSNLMPKSLTNNVLNSTARTNAKLGIIWCFHFLKSTDLLLIIKSKTFQFFSK